MKTKPKPSEMFFATGGRGKVVHLGFEVGNSFIRFLCCAHAGYKKVSPKKSDKKRATCNGCKKRYDTIQKQIKRLGVEWVCDGVWVPLEKRTYQNKINNNGQ